MPRTRPEVARDAKVREILDAAEAIARARGLRAVSVSEVARSLGLSANSVYWYFASRDELWIAVVEKMASDAFAAKAGGDLAWDRHVLWLVDRLADVYPLTAVLQDDARRSPRLAEFNRELRDRILAILADAIAEHAPSSRGAEDDALKVLAVVVGCYALEVPRSARAAVVERTLAEIRG